VKPIAERLKAVDERFIELSALPKFELPKPPKPEPTPEQRLAAAMKNWVGDAPAAFWAELDKWVRAAHINARANVKEHSDTTYGLGFEAAVEMIRDKFKSWRTIGPADSQEGD
jgi:hypothetical protein